MEVIPVINCPDFKCVKKRLKKIRKLGSAWAHIDVADGIFTRVITWHRPEDLIRYKKRFSPAAFLGRLFGRKNTSPEINLEIHLMVQNPESVLDGWLKTGAKRVVIHTEAVADGWVRIMDKCGEYKAELMAALAPEAPVQDLILLLGRYSIRGAQVLAVPPGPAGQKFNPKILEKIAALKKEAPDVKIEVDGGINPETARLAKAAGADIVTSSAYIWRSFNHAKAFEKLKSVQ
ncbi:MAG: Ribulose-phosphate 3-epimerase [Candidatus Jorgensenbacteria bacterium GW2011_GWA1_48_11]|uniref:Ribulose-phosphate 3-epimerase n=1 Tax=Candidatus Jorgensenbacteria bacterium GW2011_GWA1_48_11 TaxID=1618660 RepID=A0A0G1UBC4_9BACT|nr:MAG: Ribulose-phosphate 3-epimerase [Candidatus Jorgensenbacteria bacterium GW2011_GWA1_48_11]KKW11914.1 MAG: Ribulose-phosphate 3-epimerase [Candidatus Jorgensenbacteria bacterium GW2011_GWB1_49_9]